MLTIEKSSSGLPLVSIAIIDKLSYPGYVMVWGDNGEWYKEMLFLIFFSPNYPVCNSAVNIKINTFTQTRTTTDRQKQQTENRQIKTLMFFIFLLSW